MNLETGTVTKWLTERNFGFIERDGLPGSKVFVHWQALQMDGFKELYEGDRVRFCVESTPKGLNATNVVLLEDQQAAATG
jgi:CspA family cold shock protein